MHYLVGAILGLAVGVFMPSVARKIHARLSIEASKGVTLVEGEVRAAEKDLGKI